MQKAPYFCALEKRKCVSDKTPLRFNLNASAFEVKRPCVWIKTLWRLKQNTRTFFERLLGHKKTGETPLGCLS